MPLSEFVGPFRLLREIGRGQNATVFEAHDTRRDEVVALKVLPVPEAGPEDDASNQEETTLLRFVREADAIRRLSHPNIVRIRDAGAAEGKLYIAMERLHGDTLRARLTHGPILLSDATSIGLQVAGALRYAHEQGITHRDVKPDNIYLLPDGTAKLMDFGAARVLGEHSLTQTGSVIGSPAYMAPEQVAGETTDGRTDVWGLGATLFEAVTGAKPFAGDSVAAVMYSILHKRPDFSLVPSAALAHVLEKALAKKPGARTASARALGDELRGLDAQSGAPTWRGRSAPLVHPVLLLGLLALAGLLLWGYLLRPQTRTLREQNLVVPVAPVAGASRP